MSAEQHYLVVGAGSIGKRHIGNLRRLFPSARIDCVTASGRTVDPAQIGADAVFTDLASAARSQPHFAVIASPAPHHAEHAAILLEQGVPTLIEKPLSSSMAALAPFRATLEGHSDRIGVGYNLRRLGSAQRMKTLISEGQIGRVHSVAAEVGQYLPDWRPQTDYRQNVSAQSRLGGGALLELSHELDYLAWLFGPAETVYCSARNTGSLDIDVEDLVVAMLTGPGTPPISLQLDFLQRVPSRRCKVVGEHATLEWDIIGNRITLQAPEGSQVLFDDPGADRNRMYLDELAGFATALAAGTQPEVSLGEAILVLRQIDALRHSAATGSAVTIGAD